MRRLTLALVCAAALVAAAPAGGATLGVAVKDNAYAPKALQASVGDKVRFSWANANNPHDVKFTKAPGGAQKPSKCSLRSSGTCKRTVKKSGTYRYVCTIHLASDNMRGRIVVD